METRLSALLKDKGYNIVNVSPTSTVLECAEKMSSYKIGALIVIEDDKLVGIISERDILNKIVAAMIDPQTVRVEAIMTKEVVTVEPSTTVREAMRIVTDKRIRHLPVIENGKLIGIISIGDLTRCAMLLQAQQISSLTSYIQGEL